MSEVTDGVRLLADALIGHLRLSPDLAVRMENQEFMVMRPALIQHQGLYSSFYSSLYL